MHRKQQRRSNPGYKNNLTIRSIIAINNNIFKCKPFSIWQSNCHQHIHVLNSNHKHLLKWPLVCSIDHRHNVIFDGVNGKWATKIPHDVFPRVVHFQLYFVKH